MDLCHLAVEKNVRAFMNIIVETCRRLDVEVLLGEGDRVEYDGLYSNGYFGNISPLSVRYAVAVGKPTSLWLPVALHEFCHLEQWAEGAPVWIDQEFSKTMCAFDLVMEWCGGKDLSKEEVIRLVRLARELERDCEERALRKITQFELPLDPLEYTQKANSYLFFYTAMIETKQWYVRAPYEVPEVWTLMPTILLPAGDYDTLPGEYLEAFKKHLFA